VDGYAGLLPPGTDVYIAWVPGRPAEHLVDVAARLRRIGMNPVPHLAARALAGPAALEALLASLRSEAGVDQALVIAGDMARPAGDFASSPDLLETGLLRTHGIRKVGVAAYPEGHPKIAEPDLLAALDRKVAAAARAGLDLYVVTQFCFDGAAILNWLGRMRQRGLARPVRIGLAGPASVTTLLRYAMHCGVGNSVRALGARPAAVSRVLTRRGPERILRSLAESGAAQDIEGVHFFAFGGFRETARWMQEAAAGNIDWSDADGRIAPLP